MTIIRPASASTPAPLTTQDAPSSDAGPVTVHPLGEALNIHRTPRAQALAIILRALERGDLVTIGSTTLRALEHGEQIEEGSSCFEALANGLYQRLAVYPHGHPLDGPPSHYTWGYALVLGQAHHWIGTLYDALTPYDREILVVAVTARQVLHKHRLSRRTRPSSMSHDSTTDTPFTR